MKYTVRPETVADCNCEDCRAGRHLYSLFRWQDGQWHWAGISLQTYASAEECKRRHDWGDVGPDDTWEDGTPRAEPESQPAQQPVGPLGKGFLNTDAMRKSYEALKRHRRP